MAVKSLLFVALATGLVRAQSEPAFEVASVKPAAPLTQGRKFIPLAGGPGTKSPERFAGMANMKSLLIWAYGVRGYQITGPAWMETDLYELNARVAPGTTKEQFELMVQNLLTERFHLAVHRETRELPLYLLLVGKNGTKLQKSDPISAAEDEKAGPDPGFVRPRVTMGPDGFPQIPADVKIPNTFTVALSSGQFLRTKLFARHMPMDLFADWIAGHLKRPVKNLTEMPGEFDFTLAFESDPIEDVNNANPPATAQAGQTIFAAVQEQLGLKLEQRKGPVEMLVIDRAERTPVEN
jgi:uncharacterized protein (TIGR03435 family)